MKKEIKLCTKMGIFLNNHTSCSFVMCSSECLGFIAIRFTPFPSFRQIFIVGVEFS